MILLQKGYKLKNVIKSGNFSVVYVGEDSDGKICVVKEIEKREVMWKESETINKIGHECKCLGLVKILDSFFENGKYYVVMEYCENKSLDNFLESYPHHFDENVLFILINLF
jgi:serine/threonine protein kinase